jgi:hypothetical protein
MSNLEKSDVKDFIIRKMEQSGYSLERFVANLLAKNKWEAHPSTHYHDLDSNQDREIDIFAMKEELLEEQRILITFYLVSECKKIPGNAWVFMPGPYSPHATFLHAPQILTLLDIYNLSLDTLPQSVFNLTKKTDFFSSSFSEIIINEKISNKKENNLFEAITSLVKATEIAKEDFLHSESVLEKRECIETKLMEWIDYGSWMNIAFVFPLIVFEGEMFSAKFPLSKQTLLKQDVVHHFTKYNSAKYSRSMCLDITTKEFLPQYVKWLEKNLRLITESMKNDIEGIREEISEKIGMKFKPDLVPKK